MLSHALGTMGVVTRDQQVPLAGHYLVHVVCDLHDALLGVAQVEVLVPVLQRDGDGEGSPEEERGGRQKGVPAFWQGTGFLPVPPQHSPACDPQR